jgi:DNA processing protein
MQPTHYTFPQRNRIVAGLADLVCVPEAREGSGSLITVDFALSMRKPVY